MLPSVIGGQGAALRLGVFGSMNQRVSRNRGGFPLVHGSFADDTFCKTAGDLTTSRKRHRILVRHNGDKKRKFPCVISPVNGMGCLRSFKAIVRPAKSAFQN